MFSGGLGPRTTFKRILRHHLSFLTADICTNGSKATLGKSGSISHVFKQLYDYVRTWWMASQDGLMGKRESTS